LEEVSEDGASSRFAILHTANAAVASRVRSRSGSDFLSVNAVYRAQPGGAPILSSGHIVVRLAADIDAREREELFGQYRVTEVAPVEGLSNTFLVAPIGDAAGTELDTANALYRDVRTVYAHPDMRIPVETRQFTPPTDIGADTFQDNQWHLTTIEIFNAFQRTQGSGVLVGQLDDSCDVEHEDMAENYIGISHNAATNEQSATAAVPARTGDRHGTPAMGLMCARYFNGKGVLGVSPAAEFTASRGLEAAVTTSQIASAYTFARNQHVDVHNNSWGFAAGTANPDVIIDALRTAYDEGRAGRGMVVCFASGGGRGIDPTSALGEEVSGDDELATLSTVIGVGASNSLDQLSQYSNYGEEIDVLAPSNDLPLPGGATLPAIVSTDNTDESFPFEPGYNDAGFADDGSADLANPQYTKNYGGTSASSAIVSGIAALILSLESDYTAPQVRNIIEHTCDQINPMVAAYNGITSRSLRYGYGRVNAGTAVEATYDGYYWPERVADVCVGQSCAPALPDNTIHWVNNDDQRMIGESVFGVPITSVLVVESDTPFSWKPTDGEVYFEGQVVATGVTVVANLLAEQYTFTAGSGTKYFGVYSVADTERRGTTYGFGVAVTSAGNVIDSGTTLPAGTIVVPPDRPRVTINVSPLDGTSPLTVQFEGNAQSSAMISSYNWDFGDGTSSTNRVTQHTYTVTTGTQRFFAQLSVTDANGLTGNAAVAIDVSAPGSGSGGDGSSSGSVSIRISDPSAPESDVSAGLAPLSVILTAQVSGIGTPTSDLNIVWDLGDGNTAESLSVAHTYQIAGRFPVSVTVSNATSTLRSTRFVDVLQSATPTPTPTASPTPTPTPGGIGGLGCGAGVAVTFWAAGLLLALRRFAR
ncbi:MAG TPA: S8 family serine peptidase, partial [Phycisphaerae bacterium]|nr:S8 family serine peptidase [Phycisphaerae bacterium]